MRDGIRAIGAVMCCAGSCLAQQTFVDVAPATGIDGMFQATTGYPPEHERMAGGLAVGDFNADGRPDVFALTGGAGPDRLYINQGPDQFGVVSFDEQAALWGCDASHRSMGAAVGDVNRDGYPDIYVVSMGDAGAPAAPGASRLYINNGPDTNGQFSFTEEAAQRGVASPTSIVDGTGAAFGDYDLDGDLDLAVVAWFNVQGQTRLYENDGDGTFTDVTDQALGADLRTIRGFQPRFVDMNGDLYPELLITGDFRTTGVLVNNGPDDNGVVTLTDRRIESGATSDCNAMGSAIADFDNDLQLDWYITNIYSPPPVDNCGNTLYRFDGVDDDNTPLFTDVSRETYAYDGGWGWGTAPGDFDHDSHVDIAATGGWPFWTPVPSRLFMNDGEGAFFEEAADRGFDFTGNGRALVTLDCDDDGDLDLLLVDNGGELRLFTNDASDSNPGNANWLKVTVDTDNHPCLAPMGFGAVIYATYDTSTGGGASTLRSPVTRVRHLDGAYSYLSQGEQSAHFGLRGAQVVDRLEIHHADGSLEVLEDVPANQTVHVEAFFPVDVTRNGKLSVDDINVFVDLFIQGDALADIDRDGDTDIDDINTFVVLFVQGPCPS